ncbi:MAG: carbamoyltransferase HypF, partial [Candidatus Aenigmarchaeota archaeon]|nr:carbamoyltransferase HypF [Candidatus Aenigmarchaeota archaeon]
FKILESTKTSSCFGSGMPADTATCKECLKEMRDPKNPRHNYFFITCTSCGPRFTAVDSYPYDRKNTSLKDFEMCDSCKKEYQNPENRRFHAETIACEKCGPVLSLFAKDKNTNAKNPISETAKLILQGKIVSIKGLGGYHLTCLADNQNAVAELRARTSRPNKPFAVMARDIKMAREIAHVSAEEEKIMLSESAPIVLLKAKRKISVSELDTIGVMLPYTALHTLLFDHIDEPLAMTSSNHSDEPITSDSDEEQFANYALEHNREITRKADDSIVKPIAGKTLIVRRSRGFVPMPLELETKSPVLALGSDSMNTFCLAKDGKAVLSQHIGTLSNPKTFLRYKQEIESFLTLYNFQPKIISCDMHPQYNSTAFAKELAKRFSAKLVPVQHHIAHAEACAQEHGFSDYAAIVSDGSGHGLDGKVWGGEIIVNGKREGHLEEQVMPGAVSAVNHPKKMLFGILNKFMGAQEISKVAEIAPDECNVLEKQVAEDFNCVHTTSTGRIFDAASAFLGFCEKRTYDGRPAMLLEANSTKPLDFSVKTKGNVLLTTPLFEYLVENIDANKSRLAATVQQYIAEGMHKIAAQYKKPIVFSGGCAYNRIMTEYMISKGVYLNENVPAGDGGLSFGQTAFCASKP